MGAPYVHTNNFLQNVIQTFGLEHESPEAQAYLVSRLCDAVAAQAYVEACTKLSIEKRVEFEALLRSENTEAVEQFMSPHVGDFKTFIQNVAQKEIEDVRMQVQE